MEHLASNTRRWMLRFAIFAITFLTFSRLTACDFVFWDDQATIQDNPRLNPPSWDTVWFYWTTASEEKTMGLYVPVTWTVWTGLASISHLISRGILNPSLFHATNVLLHSITALLVFELLMELFGALIPAVIGALLFALHPVQVETVGWASGTKDLLCGLFFGGLAVGLHTFSHIEFPLAILSCPVFVCAGGVVQAHCGGGPADGRSHQLGIFQAIDLENNLFIMAMARVDDSIRDSNAVGTTTSLAFPIADVGIGICRG